MNRCLWVYHPCCFRASKKTCAAQHCKYVNLLWSKVELNKVNKLNMGF
jgi:hypothetical protein